MHILIVIFVFDFVELTHDQDSNGFEHEPVQRAKPVLKERVKAKPEQITESIRIDQPEMRVLERKVEQEERNTVSPDHKPAPKTASKPMPDSIPSSHKSYPHIEIGTSENPDAVVLRQGKGITVGNSTM
ncbi:cell envelope integrity protein TolA, partial [Aduncisulcus paluster]